MEDDKNCNGECLPKTILRQNKPLPFKIPKAQNLEALAAQEKVQSMKIGPPLQSGETAAEKCLPGRDQRMIPGRPEQKTHTPGLSGIALRTTRSSPKQRLCPHGQHGQCDCKGPTQATVGDSLPCPSYMGPERQAGGLLRATDA